MSSMGSLAIFICLTCFLSSGVVVLAYWCRHLTHGQRDLRRMLSLLTESTMSNMARQLIDLDNKPRH